MHLIRWAQIAVAYRKNWRPRFCSRWWILIECARVFWHARHVPGRRVPIFALERRNWDYRGESPLRLAAGNGFVCVAFIRTARATLCAETVVDVFSGSRIIRQTAIANPLLRNRFRRVRSAVLNTAELFHTRLCNCQQCVVTRTFDRPLWYCVNKKKER